MELLLNVQRQFVDINTSQQHRLTSLLSTIQRNVPPQPSQSYQRVVPDSDDDSDDGFYLASSSKTSNECFARISSITAIDEDDDDSDDDDDDDDDAWEEVCEKMDTAVDSAGNKSDHVSLPSQDTTEVKQECLEQAADEDFALSSSEDEELAEFAASFDILSESSVSGPSHDVNAGENFRLGVHSVAAGHSLECSDDVWQRMRVSQGAFELKVEGVDDVTDCMSEFVHQPAPPAEATGMLIIHINIVKVKVFPELHGQAVICCSPQPDTNKINTELMHCVVCLFNLPAFTGTRVP